MVSSRVTSCFHIIGDEKGERIRCTVHSKTLARSRTDFIWLGGGVLISTNAMFVLQKKDYVMAVEYTQKAIKLGK